MQNVCTCRYITIDVDPAQAADYIIILFIILYYNKHAQITGRTSIWVRSDAISSIDVLKRGIKVWKGRVIIIDGVDGWNWKHKLTLKNLKTYRKNNMLSARAVELNWIPRRKTRTSRADKYIFILRIYYYLCNIIHVGGIAFFLFYISNSFINR